jgi:hypothetical protein
MNRLATNLAILALVVDFSLGGRVLAALGVPYTDEGGSLIVKLHPGTYLAACAMAARLAVGGNPLHSIWEISWRERSLVLYTVIILYCSGYELILTGSGGLVMLFDTFLPAGMIGVALCDITAARAACLVAIFRALLLINAALALGEVVAHRHFIMISDLAAEPHEEFRPVALYDHPLTGAAATMMGLGLCPDTRRAPVCSALYTLFMFAALLAFGGRVALALAVLAAAGHYVSRFARRVAASILEPSDLALPIAAVAAGLPLAWIAMANGLADRLVAHLYWDPSAQSRVEQFRLLGLLRPEQILFGTSRVDMTALLEPMRLAYGVDAIENFWLVMFVILGALGFIVFVLGMAALLYWLWHRTDAGGRVMTICLVFAASSSNSLGHKSPLLVMLVGAVLARRHSTPLPRRSVARTSSPYSPAESRA